MSEKLYLSTFQIGKRAKPALALWFEAQAILLLKGGSAAPEVTTP
jgi:hypothetical protein